MSNLNLHPIICVFLEREGTKKIRIINIHATSEDKDIEIKEDFQNEVSRIYEELPSRNTNIILGDANANIEEEEVLRPAIAIFSKHDETDENGQFLVDCSKEKISIKGLGGLHILKKFTYTEAQIRTLIVLC